jgi:ABC-type transporter MlaC component
MYALTETIKNMTNTEQKKFLNEFSNYLGSKSGEILE